MRRKAFSIDWQPDYGIDHRRGWSITWDGSYLAELEPWLIVAVWKAWKERTDILAYERQYL